MSPPRRVFGVSSGGFDRRILMDRRHTDRRQTAQLVPFERRSLEERRSRRGRRITEWFSPVRVQDHALADPVETEVAAATTASAEPEPVEVLEEEGSTAAPQSALENESIEPLPEAVFVDLSAPAESAADSDDWAESEDSAEPEDSESDVTWLESPSDAPEHTSVAEFPNDANDPVVTPAQEPIPEAITIRHAGRTYSLEPVSFLEDGGGDIAGEWQIKLEGRLEHTLPARGDETRETLQARALRTLQETGAGAARELDFEYEGKIYHLEDRSASLSHDGSAHVSIWAVVCDGVMEGSFSSPPDESETMLRHRAVQIARRSGQYQARLEARGPRYTRPALERRPLERRDTDRREAPRRQNMNRVSTERRAMPADRRREERRATRPILQRIAAAPGMVGKILLFPIVWPFRLVVRLIKGIFRAIKVTASRLGRGIAAIFLLPVRIFRPTRRRRGRGILIGLQEWLDATPLRLLWPYLAGALVATGAITLTPNVLWAAAATAVVVLLTSAIARRSSTRHPDDLDDTSNGVTTLKLERPVAPRRRSRQMPQHRSGAGQA